MGKYMEWYVVEFEAAARKRLSPERRRDIVESLREHVEDAKQELLSHGDEEAERLAVRKLGAPLDLVLAELDTPKRQWWPVYAAVVGIALLGGGLIYGSRGIPLYLEMFPMWATPLAVLLLSLFSKRIKLWALFGATAGAAVIMAVLLAFTWLRLESAGGLGYVSMWQVQGEAQRANRRIAQLTTDAKYVEQTAAAFKTNDRKAAARLAFTRTGWQVPDSNWLNYEGIVYTKSADYALARLVWNSRARNVLSSIAEDRRKYEAQISALKSPSSRDPKAILRDNVGPLAVLMAATYAILASAHLFGLAIGSIPRKMARLRWRATRA